MNQDQYGDLDSPPQSAIPSEKLASSFQPFIENEYQVDGNLDSTEYEKKNPETASFTAKIGISTGFG